MVTTLVALAGSAAADAPVATSLPLARISTNAPCKRCKSIARRSIDRLGLAEVFQEPRDRGGIAAVWLVLDDGHERWAGKVIDDAVGPAPIRVTPRLQRFAYPTGTGSAPTFQVDVGLDLGVLFGAPDADGADTRKVFVACGAAGDLDSQWRCRRMVVELTGERGCRTADWDAHGEEPTVALACSTSLASLPRD